MFGGLTFFRSTPIPTAAATSATITAAQNPPLVHSATEAQQPLSPRDVSEPTTSAEMLEAIVDLEREIAETSLARAEELSLRARYLKKKYAEAAQTPPTIPETSTIPESYSPEPPLATIPPRAPTPLPLPALDPAKSAAALLAWQDSLSTGNSEDDTENQSAACERTASLLSASSSHVLAATGSKVTIPRTPVAWPIGQHGLPRCRSVLS